MLRWRDTVARYNLDEELVYLSYHYFDRYIDAFIYERGGDCNHIQVHLIKIASLLVAIKVKLSKDEAGILAQKIATEIIAGNHMDEQALTRTEEEMLSWHLGASTIKPFALEEEMLRTLDWHINVPTMHQFAEGYFLLHPLTAAGDDFHAEYLIEITRYQVDRAVVHPEVVMNFNPSVIAFAAMMRAEEMLDDNVLISEMKKEFDEELMKDLDLNNSVVLEASFALENSIPRLPTVDEYFTMRERDESAAEAIAARMPPENDGSHSPVSAAVN